MCNNQNKDVKYLRNFEKNKAQFFHKKPYLKKSIFLSINLFSSG